MRATKSAWWLFGATMLLVSAAAGTCARAADFDVVDLKIGGRGLLLSGRIMPGDQKPFHAAAATLQGNVVVTTGPGGSVLAALTIGNEIRARGWSTLVPAGETCASACSMVWLAGQRRMMGDGARIGFHAMSIQKNGIVTETHQPDVDLRRWLTGLGYTYDTTATIVNTPAVFVRWLDPIELRANGIAVDLYP